MTLAIEVCACPACRALDRAHPGEGVQLRLITSDIPSGNAIASASSGDRPEAAPLTDLDAPAVPAAGVSAPKAARSKRALAAAKPEPTHA